MPAAAVTPETAAAPDAPLDVLIVGAGLSGIGAAVHLQQRCPEERFAIVEAREAIGGTWDLFRYPGIRSDSDMHTLGYNFKPWTEAKAIADGPAIHKYVHETADEYGIRPHIRFSTKIVAANWSSADARWTVEATGPDGEAVTYTCNFLCMCSGYYNYARGHAPEWNRKSSGCGCAPRPSTFGFRGLRTSRIWKAPEMGEVTRNPFLYSVTSWAPSLLRPASIVSW